MTLRQIVLFYCVGIPRALSPRGDYRVGMTVPFSFCYLFGLILLDIVTINHHVTIKKDNWIG